MRLLTVEDGLRNAPGKYYRIEGSLNESHRSRSLNAIDQIETHQSTGSTKSQPESDNSEEHSPEQNKRRVAQLNEKNSCSKTQSKYRKTRAGSPEQHQGRIGSAMVKCPSLVIGSTQQTTGAAIAELNEQKSMKNNQDDVSSHECCRQTEHAHINKPRKAASQEYFTVSYDILSDYSHEVFPASVDKRLSDVLHSAFEKRKLDFNSVNAFLEFSHTPLSWQHDTFRLGGTHLRIKPKLAELSKSGSTGTLVITDSCRSTICVNNIKEPLQRKSSINLTRRRPFLGLSADENSSGIEVHPVPVQQSVSHDGSWKGSKSRLQQRKSYLFSNKERDKMDTLTEKLNMYSQSGIPVLNPATTAPAGGLSFPSRIPSMSGDFSANSEMFPDLDESFRLEESWTCFVDGHKDLVERMCQQQSAIWEMLQTEVAYINKLRVITHLFLACLCSLQIDNVLAEIEKEKLFSNIMEVASANCRLWCLYLYPMLAEARKHRRPMDPLHMQEGFIKFSTICYPYTNFCLSQPSCMQYLKQQDHDNELFKTYIAWCETQRECNRLRFTDLLAKPMQRLTKYALLLKVIERKSDCDVQKAALVEMIRHVDRFVGSVNATMRRRHEHDRLATIGTKIEGYDAIESLKSGDEVDRILRPYLQIDLLCRMPGCSAQLNRQLIMEGDLKLRDSNNSKLDVHCFLFTDMLLICKPVGSKKNEKVKVIRPPFCIDKLVTYDLKDGILVVQVGEYGLAQSAFLLQGTDSKPWHDAIKKAQDAYKQAKKLSSHFADRHINSIDGSTAGDYSFNPSEDMDDSDLDFHSVIASGHVVSRSPHYASDMSSLVHSHSGSIELSEAASGGTTSHRGPSLELSDKRASSASSSDEGMPVPLPTPTSLDSGLNPASSVEQFLHRTRSVDGSHFPVSPVMERRHLIKSNSGSNTPNTLAVRCSAELHPPHHHHYHHKSKSASEILGSNPHLPQLIVPSGKLSPTSRSKTHPPQSPSRILKRSSPVPQSGKPPLIKEKHVIDCTVNVTALTPESRTSTMSSDENGGPTPRSTFSFDIPVINQVPMTPDSESIPPPLAFLSDQELTPTPIMGGYSSTHSEAAPYTPTTPHHHGIFHFTSTWTSDSHKKQTVHRTSSASATANKLTVSKVKSKHEQSKCSGGSALSQLYHSLGDIPGLVTSSLVDPLLFVPLSGGQLSAPASPSCRRSPLGDTTEQLDCFHQTHVSVVKINVGAATLSENQLGGDPGIERQRKKNVALGDYTLEATDV